MMVRLKNIRIDGTLFGCAGFVSHVLTRKVVCVNTDHCHFTNYDNAYFRTAGWEGDYRGGRNHFATYADLPQAIVDLVNSPEPHVPT